MLNESNKYKLLEAYIGYHEYSIEMYDCASYTDKLYTEMLQYLSTFTNTQLESLYLQNYKQGVFEVLVTRVIKNLDVLDSITKIKSRLILAVIFEDGADLDLLKRKRKGVIPPIDIRFLSLNLF